MELVTIIGLVAIAIIALLALAYKEGFFGSSGEK
jgi:hypothetical protein